MTRTLLRGGVVHNPTVPSATAMLVQDETVLWVGTDAQAREHRDAADIVVELDGALLTPAFVDAHVHATSTGLALSGLDLSTCRSLTEALAALERRCRELRGHTILGHGWDETRWPERRPPTAAELDRAAYGGVVYLSRIDVHSAVVSSALLAVVPEAAGLDGYDTGGWQRRQAHHAVRRAALATVSRRQTDAAQRLTRSTAAELGIVALHEAAGPDISGESDLAGLLALARTEPGPQVIGYWGQTAAAGGLEVVARLGLHGAAGDLFVDGAIGSRTACLSAPYTDSGHERGALYLSAAQIGEHVASCTRAGVQAGFHVIGDAAMAAVVDGLQRATADVGLGAVRAARHRLEHAEMVTPDQQKVLAELGIYASVQPVFDALWGLAGGAGMYEARLGPDRASGLNPLAELARAGVQLAFGSDAPVTPIGPWAAVRAAVHHRTPGSRLPVSAAFAAHTVGGWRAGGVDDAGVLAPGQQASYAIWPAVNLVADPGATGTAVLPDLTSWPPDAPGPAALRTVLRGTTIHDSGEPCRQDGPEVSSHE